MSGSDVAEPRNIGAAGANPPARATRRDWIGLAVIALPCMLYSMDLTVLNLALPAISEQLRPSSSQLLWIVDIYGFLVAGLLIPMGTLGDRIGRRKLLLIGAAAFGVASVVAAFSNSAHMLIATRALLGVAGATLAPSTLSLIRNMFLDAGQRTIAIGVWITSYSVGAAIGPLLGGVLLEYFWWGSVFLVGVPVMVLLLVLGPILLPEFRDPKAGRMDLTSVALSLLAVLMVIYGLKQVAENGLRWPFVLSIVIGVGVGVIFVRRQRSLADPLLDLGLFRTPAFSAALATYTFATFVAFGSFVFISQYLQLVLGLSPLQAGLWTLPWAIGFIVGSNLTPVLARRVRPANIMAIGLGVAAIGYLLLTAIDMQSGLELIVVSSIFFSLGLAPIFTLTTDMLVGAAPPERAGAAAAMSETGSEFGGALGIAILGSIGTYIYRTHIAAAIPDTVPADAAAAALDTLGGALAVSSQLPQETGAVLLEAARESFGKGLQVTAATCAVITIGIAIMVAVLLRRGSKDGDAAGTGETQANEAAADCGS